MKTPVLKKHKRGTWYTRHWHEGKDHFKYFTTDHAESQRLFAAWLTEWTQQKLSKPPKSRRGRIRIVEVAEQWLTNIELTHSRERMVQYRCAVQNFIHLAGEAAAANITIEHLEAHAADLRATYSVPTVRAYCKAVKMMLLWAHRRRLIAAKPDFSDLRLPKSPRPTPRYYPPQAVAEYIESAAAFNKPGPPPTPPQPQLRHWLSLIYLTCARPGEVHRLIYAWHKLTDHKGRPYGAFITPHGGPAPIGFETRGKTQDATGYVRYIPLSREALRHLELSRPVWSLRTFLQAASRATPPQSSSSPRGAKVLRSCGASELRRQGIPREEVKQVLGHSTVEPIDHYVAESQEHLRALVSRLRIPPVGASTAAEDDLWCPS